MNFLCRLITCLTCLGTCALVQAAVVINEVFYNPPDDIPKLQWIELHNPDAIAVDISGWKLSGGVKFEFPKGGSVAPGGFAIVAQDQKRFQEYYTVPILGEFKKSLKQSGETLELLDQTGKRVDRVQFSNRTPWPLAADGYSASLERISPSADGMLPANWAASPTSLDESVPAGTPGARNHAYSRDLPSAITKVSFAPTHPKPGAPIEVKAVVEPTGSLQTVELRFQVVRPGEVSDRPAIPMRLSDQNRYIASIPSQENGTLVRFKIRAVDTKGAERSYPAGTDLRPAMSFYVQSRPEISAIPLAYVINTDPTDVANSARSIQRASRGAGNPFQNPKRWQALEMLDSGLNLESAWVELTVNQAPDAKSFRSLRKIFSTRAAERQKLVDDVTTSTDIDQTLAKLPDQVAALKRAFSADIQGVLPPHDKEAFDRWSEQQSKAEGRGPESFFTRLLKIEGGWLAVNQRFELNEGQLAALRPALKKALEGRSLRNPELSNLQPGAGSFPKLQAAFGKVEKQLWADIDPVLTFPQKRYLEQWTREHGSFIRPRLSEVRAALAIRPVGPYYRGCPDKGAGGFRLCKRHRAQCRL